MKTKVIVSAIGAVTGFGIVRALSDVEDVEVIGINSKAFCPASKYVDKFIVCPKFSSDDYLDFVNNLIKEEGVLVYFLTLPPEFKFLNDICCNVAAPCSDVVSTTINKSILYEFLEDRNLSAVIPDYKVIHSIADFDSFNEKCSNNNLPFCIKEVAGHGSIGFKIIAGPKLVAKYFFEDQISNWCTYKAISEILSMKDIQKGNMMVCEYLSGEEFSVDVFAIDGESKTIVTRKRNRIINGIVLEGEVVKHDTLISYTKKIVAALGLDGFSNLQFKFNDSGYPKLIDFNPRFCGSQLISYGAGVNFPYLVINRFRGVESEKSEIKWGTVSLRYWDMDFFYDGDSV